MQEQRYFSDRLLERARQCRSRVIVGLDPQIDAFPGYVQERLQQEADHELLEEMIVAFNRVVIEATADLAAAYKPQAAFYEQYGFAGLRALQRTIALLREQGLLVIMDAKRNDVAHTAAAYATAWLAPRHPLFAEANSWQVDALTVNGYLGSDGIRPFQEVNRKAGLFVLAKTSNPSSGELQDRALCEEGVPGLTVAEKMATLVAQWGKGTEGEEGYAQVGMVVGATYPEMAQRLRGLAPHALILLPGIGAQGGSLQAIVAAAGERGNGAYAASSRAVLYPYHPEELRAASWPEECAKRIRQVAQQLRERIEEQFVGSA
ncbi:orotidine-5'-phosphate decarboxylase [Candidatus Magnetaquicoccus inordinatus]|uniref:orotidine-5'-phosphate decarboxylase n=1 Tax=Candidatus Magnetaquicoccus inordinatus TaxID=2496818 RepID=UPI00187D4579|nr:orotidine-5'-phosphate decarboxylase [Candidatus Magnetaquicoccus inordinatus]